MKKISILFLLLGFMTVSSMVAAQPRYNMKTLQREKLNRGVVVMKTRSGKVFVSWRTMSSDKKGEPFTIYRNGELLTEKPLTTGGTFYEDKHPLAGQDATYEVRGGNKNGLFTLKADAQSYLSIPLEKPQGGMTPDSVAGFLGRGYQFPLQGQLQVQR